MLTDVKTGMGIKARCHQYFKIIEDRIRSVKNQLQNIDRIIKEKVKHEVHGQLKSDMNTILKHLITVSHANIKNIAISDLSQAASDKVDNLKENEERMLNIIVSDVEQSASNIKNKRNEHDIKVLLKLAEMK